MLGRFLSRAFMMVLGYLYPAFECYKITENNNAEPYQLLFWCQYWILVAVLTVLEVVGDALVSWFPLYGEAKVALFVYLWYPKTKGTGRVYSNYLRPFVAKHEKDIDHYLLALKNKFMTSGVVFCQKVGNYGLERFFEILQYVSSQSALRSQAPQVSTNEKKK